MVRTSAASGGDLHTVSVQKRASNIVKHTAGVVTSASGDQVRVSGAVTDQFRVPSNQQSVILNYVKTGKNYTTM